VILSCRTRNCSESWNSSSRTQKKKKAGKWKEKLLVAE